jgi:hypothetical protein
LSLEEMQALVQHHQGAGIRWRRTSLVEPRLAEPGDIMLLAVGE